MSGKRIEVDERLLTAADRLYDAVAEVLSVLQQSPPHRLLALDGLQAKLQAAQRGYDDAISREDQR